MQAQLAVFPIIVVCVLLFVAALAIGTVLIASRRQIIPWRGIGSVLSVIVWVVPAVGLVALIASRSRGHFDDGQPQTTQPVVAVAQIFQTPEPQATRLKVKQISNNSNWTSTETVAGRELIKLSSQRFATLIEAEEQVTAEARETIKQRYRSEFPLAGDFEVPLAIVEKSVVDSMGEVMDKDFGGGITGKMYRAHLSLDFSPELQTALHGSWRGEIAKHRLVVLGSLTALVTMMLSTAAGYFRLDDLTGGNYRKRLKLAAAALVAAGGLVVAQVIA
jgi:hypothetical protein